MLATRRSNRSRALRGQVRAAIAAIVVASLLLFGVPLGVVLGRLIDNRALTGLQRDATRALAVVPDNAIEAGTVLTPPRASAGTLLGVYDVRGRRVTGTGPTTSGLAALARDGREHDGADAGDLAVVVPVLSDTTVAGSVRAAVPLAVLRRRVATSWALLALLAGLVVGLSALAANRAARWISAPFEQLTVAARELGSGRSDVRLPAFGIAEADAAGTALTEGARSVHDLLARERDFKRHASHQLRPRWQGLSCTSSAPRPMSRPPSSALANSTRPSATCWPCGPQPLAPAVTPSRWPPTPSGAGTPRPAGSCCVRTTNAPPRCRPPPCASA